jgi:sigma-B regulation protein RsbU (phosphoserine phosphatase)
MRPQAAGNRVARAIVLALSLALGISGLVSSGQIFTRAYVGMNHRNVTVAQVSPSGPAAVAGIRPGDRIVAVDGVPVSTSADARLAVRGLKAGGALSLKLESPGGETRTVILSGAKPPWDEIAWRFTNAAAGLCALLVGLFLAYHRPEKLTLVFFGICFAIAFFLREQPTLLSAGWRTVHESLYNFFEFLLPALFVHFFILFPGHPPSRRRRWVEHLLYLPPIAIALITHGSLMNLGTRGSVDVLQRESFHLTLITIYFVAYVALAVILFVRSFRRTQSGRERAQLRVALWGTVLGITPLLVATTLVNLFPGADLPGLRYSVFALLLIPASFAYAAFRHQIFDVEILVKQSVLYSVLTALLLAVYFGVVIGLGGLLHRLTGANNPLLSVVSVVVIALIASPARARLQRLTDRFFYRQRYDARLALRRFSHDLARMLELGGIATLLVERVVDLLDLEFAVLLVRRAPGQPFVPVHAAPPLGENPASLSEHVAFLFTSIQSSDSAPNARAPASDSGGAQSRPVRLEGPDAARLAVLLHDDRRAMAGYGAAVAVPLWGRERLLAVLLLGPPRSGIRISQGDFDLLETLGEQASIAIENSLLHRTALDRERMAQELAVARGIQAHLVPDREPECDTVEFSGSSLASHEIGGDFYDYVPLQGLKLGLAIGDVSGKGIPAALLMAGLQSSFRLEAERGTQPAKVLAALNKSIHAVGGQDRFVCFFYGLLDLQRRQLTYSNAGLDPPVLVRASGRVERLRSGGPVLGILPEARFVEGKVSLASGDTLVLYTDGLVEPAEEISGVGEAELIEFLIANRQEPAARLRELVLARLIELAGDTSQDDTTLIVARAR